MNNKIIDCDDFSLCMIDKELINQICKYTQNVKNAGNHIPLKSRHEAYWINKLENNEIKYLKDEFGFKAFFMYDDIFTLNKKRLHKIIELIKPLNPGHQSKELCNRLLRVFCHHRYIDNA